MAYNSFTITSDTGFYNYPLPTEAPFKVSISLRGVDAHSEIDRLAAVSQFVLLSQVHSDRVIEAESASLYPERDRADGLLIAPDDPVCGLRFGDCAPVVILSLGKSPWILALHSGFRGTLQNIVGAGLKKAVEKFGLLSPNDLYAWVGPCIGGKCYDRCRDDPTTQEALESFVPAAVDEQGEKVFFDLKIQIAAQLTAGGVCPERIYLETQCTHCRTDLFYSHRSSVPGDDPRMLLTVSTCHKTD